MTKKPLPHNHGQNIERQLDHMPETAECPFFLTSNHDYTIFHRRIQRKLSPISISAVPRIAISHRNLPSDQ